MGFLEVGTPLSWDSSQKIIKYIKEHGIAQLLHVWKVNKDRHDNILCWGDEIEYSLVDVDSGTSLSRIFAEASGLIEELKVREHIRSKGAAAYLSSEWHPEFSNHMIEALPSPPYFLNLHSILVLEPSMRLRRAKMQSVLPEDKFVVSLSTFPRFGLKGFIESRRQKELSKLSGSKYSSAQKMTKSIFITDDVFNPHPRFPTLVQNVPARRGANIFIKIPIYKDRYTGQSRNQPRDAAKEAVATDVIVANKTMHDYTDSPENDEETLRLIENDWTQARDVKSLDRFKVQSLAKRTINPVKDYIYMDCLAFGMSMSCVQTTFACQDIKVARYVYDQFIVLAPIFLALSAVTPFHRGLLSDYDTRWSALEQAVDCRTEAEETGDLTRSHPCSVSPPQFIPKSRYSGVSLYISDSDTLFMHEKELNDTDAVLNQEVYQTLRNEGMDHLLAQHYAHLWIRDPMVIFNERTYMDDTKNIDHFENIQSTNWNSVRFKPPPPQFGSSLNPIGWRVEFRSPDVQLTDFDNAASVALISVITQAILMYDLNFMIPMSQNDVNMKRSWQRDAITNQKFFFRKNPFVHTGINFAEDIEEMSIYEILVGKPSIGYPGLIPICEQFISDTQGGQIATRENTSSEKISCSNTASNIHLSPVLSASLEVPQSAAPHTEIGFSLQPGQTKTSGSQQDFFKETADSETLSRLDSNINHSRSDQKLDSEEHVPCFTPILEFANKKEQRHVITPPKIRKPLDRKMQDSMTHVRALSNQARLCFAHFASLHLNRAAGKISTGAQFLRKFVLNHPTYQQDSVINPTICYDLVVLSILIGFGLCTSVDLHGEATVHQLILPTPLPAKLKLPQLSPEGQKMIHYIHEKTLGEPIKKDYLSAEIKKAASENRFVLIKKDMIALNEINSIYTMPMGVTARTGHLQKVYSRADDALLSSSTTAVGNLSQQTFSADEGTHDLIQLTMEVFEYKSKFMRQQNGDKGISVQPPKLQNVISNEEFTQAWILKGIDCIGGPTNLESDYGIGSLTERRLWATNAPGSISDSLHCTTENDVSNDCANVKDQKSTPNTDHASTICTTACDCPTCTSGEEENDLMNELSMLHNFGFNNEQELEYFQQVCEASA